MARGNRHKFSQITTREIEPVTYSFMLKSRVLIAAELKLVASKREGNVRERDEN